MSAKTVGRLRAGQPKTGKPYTHLSKSKAIRLISRSLCEFVSDILVRDLDIERVPCKSQPKILIVVPKLKKPGRPTTLLIHFPIRDQRSKPGKNK